MKKNLSCEIIRDLLPNYIDGHISKETYDLIFKHLSDCKECKEEFENMKISLTSNTTHKKNIDFLKGVRKKSRNLLILCIILSCILFLISSYIGINEVGDTFFLLGLLLIVAMLTFVKFVLPLLLSIISFFLFKKSKRKLILIITLISSVIYIVSILSTISNIITYGF